MRDYQVHFSFYSEEWGNFDEVSYSVTAGDSFEARERAWAVCDQDEDTKFRSNIKQFAVTWEPNLLDAGDYFYSHAASIKQNIGHLMYVEIPNDCMTGEHQKQRLERERCSELAALYTLDTVAKDLYADKGMLPPSIYEELHYAEKLCEQIGWGEKADALWERMDKARKWDQGAIYSIRDLFENGYTMLCGQTERFREHFGREGIYPVHDKLDEYDYSYISRWQNKKKIDRVVKIPSLKESDVIKNSEGRMKETCEPLLLNIKMLSDGYQTRENQFWQLAGSAEHGQEYKEGMLFVENLITGLRMSCREDYFLGILRPDIAAGFEFDVLKEEYVVIHGMVAISDRDFVDYSDGTGDRDNGFER